MAGHIHPVDIPPRFYRPIGQIITGWNLTEALVSSIIWHFHRIKEPPRGRLFTYRLNSYDKLILFLRTAQDYVSDRRVSGTLCRMYGEIDDVRKERNNIAHGWWGRMPKEHGNWKVFYPKYQDEQVTSLIKREAKNLKGSNLRGQTPLFRHANPFHRAIASQKQRTRAVGASSSYRQTPIGPALCERRSGMGVFSSHEPAIEHKQ